MSPETLTIELEDEAATTRLGADLAAVARVGDVFALSGDLGAGKTTLARGFVRALAGDPALDVPSPTFTLVQSYPGRIAIHHFDLYRLAAGSDLDELGFDEAVSEGVALVEWPERAADLLPADRIRIELAHRGDGRVAMIDAPDTALRRLRRTLAIRRFLADAGAPGAARTFLLGDASTRTYETISAPGAPKRILMNAPRQPDGPPIRDGKPYSQIAHLAESVTPFVAIAKALTSRGFCAPKIFAQDLDQGLLLIEHLGDGGFLDAAGAPVRERYLAAATLLAGIHRHDWPLEMEAAPGVVHHLPLYDREAMMIEAELLTDWYVPEETGTAPTDADRAEYRAAWDTAISCLATAEKSIVLRDYHSPNIIWREERSGNDRLGIIDFQDALWGPAAYDVASLAQDARVTIPPELERATVDAYKTARRAQGAFDEAAFDQAYAIMAAQRNSKILGIFVRLNRRDGKPQYLKHLPRIRDYVGRVLPHPALAAVRDFYLSRGLLG
ncbi:MAG: tRNA (adenosine(37)-N6)-threonylcarbamoyltransferase complex ATPase subunit type 1 TsaE [Mesorhizobium sp.]|nr:tRNA (adenosine(37)-N6)-threonylcarbamoyltransferase complex ATPase subunit type 1 TsaE [Mesorhizobium sp.]